MKLIPGLACLVPSQLLRQKGTYLVETYWWKEVNNIYYNFQKKLPMQCYKKSWDFITILSLYLNLYSNFQIIFSRWVLSVAVSSLSRQQFSLLSTPPTAPHLDPTGGRCKPLQSPGQNVPTTKVMRVGSDTFGDPLYLLKSSPIFWRGLLWSEKMQILQDFMNEAASNPHDFTHYPGNTAFIHHLVCLFNSILSSLARDATCKTCGKNTFC